METMSEPAEVPQQAPTSEEVDYADFTKVILRVGTILWAMPVPKSKKLLELSVDLGEEKPRTIVSGVALAFPNGEGLEGVQALFVTNLKPVKLMGIESRGMLLAIADGTPIPMETGKLAHEDLALLQPTKPCKPGTRAR